MSIRSRLHGLIYNQSVSSGAFDCNIQIDINRFARNLDAAEYWLANEILQNSNDFAPFREGTLRESGHVIDTDEGYRIEWSTPYAHYLYEGVLYVNPQHNASGWMDKYGQWHGWPGAKTPTEKHLEYHTEGTSDHWIDEAKKAYMSHWIKGTRRVAGGHDAG